MLTSFDTDDKVFAALHDGALGYTLKEADPADLIHAIRWVYYGGSSLHPTIARKVLQELAPPPEQAAVSVALTEREVKVLSLIARGESNQQIAATLWISEAIVRTHVSNILHKLHLTSRAQAALYAVREGLTAQDDGAST